MILSAGALAAAQERPSIRRSDVVFMYDNPKLYQVYGCTAMGWAGSWDARRVEAAHAQGVRLFAASVGFRTEFAAMIDFAPDFLEAASRNVGGETFIVPWLWDHKHKGQPAWWFCTNSPLYRRYLESRLERMMKAPLDGLHIDDYSGTAGAVSWLSACFCRNCLAGFREYLSKSVAKEKLDAVGIKDLATFDYRQFLLERGVKPKEYNARRSGLPLAAEFYDYQVKANNAYVAEYRRRAEALRGRPLALCVNSGLGSPADLAIAPHLTFFCCEVEHRAADRAVPVHPAYVYKLADGLSRPVTSTAGGGDWACVKEHKLAGLVRTWIAMSYAFGHNLMAPHRQWCYTQEKGTHWYDGPTDQYAWLYQFVRQHAGLLDGYDAVAPVAVVYDNAARRKGLGNIEPVCTALAAKNVPFTVVVAGDDWLDYRLDAGRLAAFKAVIVAKDHDRSPLDPAQKKLLEKVRADGRLVVWPDEKRLAQLVPAAVVVEGTDQVFVVPRIASGKKDAAVVVHLVNRRYDAKTDAMVPQENLTLRLRRDLLPGRQPAKAILHAPKESPRTLDVAVDGESIVVKLPRLTLWAILELP
jgi:hypothetical protein